MHVTAVLRKMQLLSWSSCWQGRKPTSLEWLTLAVDTEEVTREICEPLTLTLSCDAWLQDWYFLPTAHPYPYNQGTQRLRILKPLCSTRDMFSTLRLLCLVTTLAGAVLGVISSSVDDHAQILRPRDDNLPARVPYVFPSPGTNAVSALRKTLRLHFCT